MAEHLMYGALWRVLLGPWWAKTVQCAVLLVLVLAILFMWVFPAVSPLLPFTGNTVGE
ncbi:MAG: hypothetical protein ACRCYX_15655 [Dermatophilaceae bacterium]